MLVLGMEKADMHRSGKKGRGNSPGQGLGFGRDGGLAGRGAKKVE